MLAWQIAQPPQCITLPSRNSCRTLCSQTTVLLGPSGLCSDLGSRPERGLGSLSQPWGWALFHSACLLSCRHPPFHQHHRPWSLLETGPGPAGQSVLTLAGGLCEGLPQFPVVMPTVYSRDHLSCFPLPSPYHHCHSLPPHGNVLGTVLESFPGWFTMITLQTCLSLQHAA